MRIKSGYTRIKKKTKRTKKYGLLPDKTSEDSKSSITSSIKHKLKKLVVKINKKSKDNIPVPKLPFDNIHEHFGRPIHQTQEDLIMSDKSS